jgi:hypothetical protein
MQIQRFHGSTGNIQRLPSREKSCNHPPKDGYQPSFPKEPSKLVLAAKAGAVGAVAIAAVGYASQVSPFLGAAVGAVAGGLSGLALGVQGGEFLVKDSQSQYGGLTTVLGTAILGGAVGLAGGAAMPFLASPLATGITLGSGLGAAKYILDTH